MEIARGTDFQPEKSSTVRADVGKSKSEYSPDIDGLRALAVISVIINHFNKDILPGGYLGVDIFFVISGYVITSSLYDKPGRSITDLFLNFYVKRIKRLVPALVVCVVVSSLLICLFDPNPGISLRTGIASLFGFSNIYLLRQATDYFGASAQLNIFTQTWSLGVEEQFYIFFPFIVWFSGFGRLGQVGLNNLTKVVGVISFISSIIFIRKSNLNSPAAFYLMPTRFWELGAGSLVFLTLNSLRNPLILFLGKIKLWFVILSIVGVLFIPVNYSIYTTIAIVFLTAALIAVIKFQNNSYRILANPVLVYIGRISYSLYLWHWIVLVISRWTIGVHLWSAPLQVVLIFLFAAASYRYIENPMRHAPWSYSRVRSIIYGVCSLIGVAAFSVVLAKPLDGRLYSGTPPKLISKGVASLTDNYYLLNGVGSWGGKKCVLSDNLEVGKNISIESCTLGEFEGSKHRVMLIGNSFSTTFVRAFDQMILHDGYSVTITSSWGASPVPEVPNTGTWNKANDYYWNKIIPSLFSRLKSGDWVFLASDLAEFSPEKSSINSDQKLKILENGIVNLSKKLANQGVRLAVLHGNPFAREAECDPAVTAQWFTPFGGPCHFISKEKTLLRRSKLSDLLARLQDQEKIAIVDLIEVFCPGKICTYEASNGEMLYRDSFSHPSVEAARLSEPLIRSVLVGSKVEAR